MRMNKANIRPSSTFILLMVLTWSGTAISEELLKQCNPIQPNINSWKELETASNDLDKIISAKDSRTSDIQASYEKWASVVINSAQKLDEAYIPNDGASIEDMAILYFYNYGETGLIGGDYPQFSYESGNEATQKKAVFSISTSNDYGNEVSSNTFLLTTEKSQKVCEQYMQCKTRDSAPLNVCDAWAEGFARATGKHFATIRQNKAIISAKKDVAVKNEWNRYFDESRFQYPWEQSITAWVARDSFKGNKLPTPPTHQYFLGHLGLSMEYVGDAEDGSQFKVAPTVEWVGFNSWNSCVIFGKELISWPCGASLVSTWTDRAGVSDFGHGAMIHLKNSYSLGATWRSDGDVGVVLSFDLLKAIDDKKSSVGRWQSKIGKYF